VGKMQDSFDKEELLLKFFWYLGGENLSVSKNSQYSDISFVYLNICELYLAR
jgi:hypothetical protein